MVNRFTKSRHSHTRTTQSFVLDGHVVGHLQLLSSVQHLVWEQSCWAFWFVVRFVLWGWGQRHEGAGQGDVLDVAPASPHHCDCGSSPHDMAAEDQGHWVPMIVFVVDFAACWVDC